MSAGSAAAAGDRRSRAPTSAPPRPMNDSARNTPLSSAMSDRNTLAIDQADPDQRQRGAAIRCGGSGRRRGRRGEERARRRNRRTIRASPLVANSSTRPWKACRISRRDPDKGENGGKDPRDDAAAPAVRAAAGDRRVEQRRKPHRRGAAHRRSPDCRPAPLEHRIERAATARPARCASPSRSQPPQQQHRPAPALAEHAAAPPQRRTTAASKSAPRAKIVEAVRRRRP